MTKLPAPPPLAVVDEIQVANSSPTESPPFPAELARVVPPKNAEYAATKKDGEWLLAVTENGEYRHLTESEARKVASIMNEQGSNIITLFCRNEKCRHKGSFIKRSSDDVKKNTYFCDSCKSGMTR